MNNFFRSAIERYKKLLSDHKNDGFLINPISEIDLEIIRELCIIIGKLGSSEVVQIMKSYKEYKDEEIRDTLLQWNIDYHKKKTKVSADEEQPVDSEEPLPAYLKIQGLIFHIYDFVGMEEIEYYDEEQETMVYQLRINPTPEDAKKVPIYANRIVTFDSEQDRQDLINSLESLFLELGRIIVKL